MQDGRGVLNKTETTKFGWLRLGNIKRNKIGISNQERDNAAKKWLILKPQETPRSLSNAKVTEEG